MKQNIIRILLAVAILTFGVFIKYAPVSGDNDVAKITRHEIVVFAYSTNEEHQLMVEELSAMISEHPLWKISVIDMGEEGSVDLLIELCSNLGIGVPTQMPLIVVDGQYYFNDYNEGLIAQEIEAFMNKCERDYYKNTYRLKKFVVHLDNAII